MKIDLSGTIKLNFDKALAEARSLESKGEYEKASATYKKAVKLMSSYADSARIKEDEIRRRQKAKQLSEYADILLKSPPPRPSPVAQTAETSPSLPEQLSDYKTLILPLIHKSTITWDDIGGLEDVKNEIKYTYGLTLAKKPEGVHLAGWRNILFYGLPGTGKTLLAAATSNGLNATFFNVKASDLLSKYFGESTKLISALYDAARDAADTGFSVIFIDEIDALSLERGSGSESGAERRIVSTLLAELDGLAEKGDDRFVLTIGATNHPSDLDKAIISRFQKQIFIPLPDKEARKEILKIHLEKKGIKTAVDYEELAGKTEYFSGRDIERFCTESINLMVAEMNRDVPKKVDAGRNAIESYELKLRPLSQIDFDKAFEKVKVDRKKLAEQEEKYQRLFKNE